MNNDIIYKKTVLITGASRGIGQETARLFAKEHYNIIVNYHTNEEKALALVQELSHTVNAIAIKADVSSTIQVQSMISQAYQRFGTIDVLVNNAGIAQQKLFSDISEDDWNRMFDINVKGMFHCAQAVLPSMLHHKTGKIINISSIWGLTGASCEVHYSAAKAAVIGFTKALAKELGPSNIQVNCVAPGVIETDMNEQLEEQTILDLKEATPLGTFGQPIDIANAILFLASEKSNFITGQIISPNGGFLI